MTTPIEQLCEGMPKEFRDYFEYVRSLRFEDKPDYGYLKRLFKDLFCREGFAYDYEYDWCVANSGGNGRRSSSKGKRKKKDKDATK